MEGRSVDQIGEPFALEERDGTVIVTVHVVGDFPGSPIDFGYFVTLADDGIASLEIRP